MARPLAKFSIFDKSVNVLAADDSPHIRELLQDSFHDLGLYNLLIADSTCEAKKIIETGEMRIHACLFDLGLRDVEGNEFYLLDKYGAKIPFVIMSAQDDTEKSFEARNHGARAYVRKGHDFIKRLITQCDRQALRSIVCPACFEDSFGHIRGCVEALINKKPAFINDWAKETKITDRQLRYEWEEHFGFSPKHSLCVFHLYSYLFDQIETMYECGKVPDRFWWEQCLQSLSESVNCKRFLDYYLTNQNSITALK